jgi:hypothetical protein
MSLKSFLLVSMFSMLQILYSTYLSYQYMGVQKTLLLPPSLPGSGCEGGDGQCAACTRTTISTVLPSPLHITNYVLKPNRNARSRILGTCLLSWDGIHKE